MPASNDPYRQWLGIADPQRPLNHYALLKLKPFESDEQRIENAAMLQMAEVLRHESGSEAAVARRIYAEIEQAAACLGNPKAKAEYDAGLRAQSATPRPASDDDYLKYLGDDESAEPAPESAALAAAPVSPRAEPPAEPASQPAAAPSRKASKPAPPVKPPKSRSASGGGFSLPSMPKVSPAALGASALLAVALLAIAWQLTSWRPSSNPVPLILVDMQSEDPEQRYAAIQTIKNRGADAESIPHLLKALKEDPVYGVRYAAADALAHTSHDLSPFASELNSALTQEKDATVRNLLKQAIEKRPVTPP